MTLSVPEEKYLVQYDNIYSVIATDGFNLGPLAELLLNMEVESWTVPERGPAPCHLFLTAL